MALIGLLGIFWVSSASVVPDSWRSAKKNYKPILVADTGDVDLPLPHGEDPLNPTENTGGISLDWPENINYNVQYDPITGQYVIGQTIGDSMVFRPSTSYSLDEYMNYDIKSNISEYWNQLQEDEDEANNAWAPKLDVGGEGFKNIFGSNEITIRPQGSAELTLGFNTSKTENPRIPIRQQRITTFDFQQRIQLNVVGNIGTKLKLTTQYNTEATFDFENQMKLEYTGEEDEIIKKIEAGNVSMPLQGTLISGSQSLFGVKMETQFGRLRNTTVFSQQQGERKEITVEGGAQTQLFDIRADNYEANKHYFLSQWFRDQYDEALASLPVVNSGVNITRIEVWVVNTQANTQDVRNVIGFSDLGEHPNYLSSNLNTGQLADGGGLEITANQSPSNLNNDIFNDMISNDEVMGYTGANGAIAAMGMGYQQGIHYERVGNARKLTASEYTYNARLGFISLRQALNNAEVLAVSYEYTLGGETYQVGTLSQDGFAAPSALILKMLKSSITQVKLDNGDPAPMWDLMMKNVYSIGAFGVNRDNFRLDVWYNDPSTGIDLNYIPREGLNDQLLLQIMNLDKLDQNTMPNKDGFFDFVDNAATQGGTIQSQNGRIYFPVVEPFGEHLAQVITEDAPAEQVQSLINTIVYQPLYDSTKTAAQQIPSLNRFKIRGQFQSASSSEISLNALNVPQGSVSVTAGGVRLVENQDYTVDYNLGRVKILNEGLLDSGTPINISLESNSLFNIQLKTLIGSRFDYEVNDNMNIGATVLNMRERPLTQKVNIGDEPVNNTILGADFSYQDESEFITRLVDRIPLIDTKAKSSIDISAEAAYLIPGHSRAIGKDGNAYIDDFEGSQSVIDIRSVNQWFMASTPKLQTDLFPEGNEEDSLVYNYNRAKLSWYVIDPQFFQGNGLTDGQVSADVTSDHRMREVLEGEVFPNRELPAGTPPLIATLDMTYYPDERGPYNYELPDGSPTISAGLNPDGTLREPETRWGGIQRSLVTTDFETSNIQFIQFWLMDPFNDDSQNVNGGELYFNLGNVSEDVLNDSQLSYENGLPSQNQELPTLESIWGVYPDPTTFNVVNAFDNSSGNYVLQDVGLDGLNSQAEQTFFDEWLQTVQPALDPAAFAAFQNDPSADDFEFFRSPEAQSSEFDILRRYKNYNGYDGNSNTATPNGYPIAQTTIPNTEDINQDITLSTIESYYQYQVSLRPQDLGEQNIGNNYITDSFEQTVETRNGEQRTVRWYQFKVPLTEYDKRVGGISDFRSIRFIRMFMKGWSEEVTLRFARLELIRGEWRPFLGSLEGPQEIEPGDPDPTTFNIGAVNIEENGNREPVPYLIPPGIIREIDVGTANQRRLNEQSLAIEVCNLQDGDARAAYRNVNFDMRLYDKLKMYIHAEAGPDGMPLNNNDLTCFVRLGSDFDENYYEYELPMTVTPWFSNDEDEIWPEDNDMEIEFSKFQNLKLSRPSGYPSFQVFEEFDGTARIRVKGNPNLANVIVCMIGIRNPQSDDNPFQASDDGLAKCANVWVNELRLTDFDEKGGWAAVARMNATLADFGSVSVAANMSTPGWGGLEQRVLERQRETIRGVDANTTLQLGKFFPENLGLQLPMYLGYSETVSTPQFDPLQPDIELDNNELTPQDRKRSQSIVKRRSINFTNVRINPTGDGGVGKTKEKAGKKDAETKDAGGKGKGDRSKEDKDRFYDISNFSLSYGYNEVYRRDINLDFQLTKNYTGGLNYQFQNKPKEIKPFAKIGFVKKSPLLKWVKDFNFYTGIKSFTFNTQMDRTYETSRVRNNTEALFGVESNVLINTQVLKTWNWTRAYNMNYDITKALKFDFSANNIALVGEPSGVIDKEDTDWYTAYKDTVWNNIRNFGETTNYNHTTSLSYKLPFDKLPLVNFISSDARYQASYRWDRAPFSQDSLGNTIQNSRALTFNAQANLVNLYNKVDFLKEANSNKPKRNNRQSRNEDKDGFGNEEEKEEKREKVDPTKAILRFLMMVRNVSGTYQRNEGILLPGYTQNTQMFGMDPSFTAPGIPFVIGQQNTDLLGNPSGNFALEAAENGWISNSSFLNQQYTETYQETWNVRANIEPINHLKIELTANRQEGRSKNSFFRFDEELGEYDFQSPMETGNFTASINTWATAFVNDDADFNNEIFDQFLLNRLEISSRLNDEAYQLADPEDNGYYAGWGPTSQEVTIAAFIAAYTGQDASEVNLDPFKTKVAPNWRVTYDGLTKLPRFKKRFKQFNISHTYRSTMTASYVTNLNFESNAEGLPTAVDQSEFGNFISDRQISTVTISEQLAPLIGFDMTLKTQGKNDPQIRVEMGRDRTLAFGLSNYQITETRGNSIVLGLGYRFTEVRNPFYRQRGNLPVQMLKDTELSIRADLTIRDNATVIRKMQERQNQPTAGQRIVSIKTTADLEVSRKLTLRFFYDHQLTRPKISTSFPTSNINSGITLRFQLTQ